MAGKDTEHCAYDAPAGAAYARQRDLRTGGTRVFIDLDESWRGEREKCWSLGLGSAGKMQGGWADGQ